MKRFCNDVRPYAGHGCGKRTGSNERRDRRTTEQTTKVSLCKEIYPDAEQDGDLYHGLTRKLSFDRMIPPHGLEVTYDKTVHVIFPAAVRYVDLGSRT